MCVVVVVLFFLLFFFLMGVLCLVDLLDHLLF